MADSQARWHKVQSEPGMSCGHRKQGNTQRLVGLWQKYTRTRLKRLPLVKSETILALKRVSAITDYIHKSIVKEKRERMPHLSHWRWPLLQILTLKICNERERIIIYHAFLEDDKGKLFFIEECQLINVEEMRELKYHHFVILNEIIDFYLDDPWMLKVETIRWKGVAEKGYLKVPKYSLIAVC